MFLASLFTVAWSSWDESPVHVRTWTHTVWNSRSGARRDQQELTVSADLCLHATLTVNREKFA